MDCWINILWIGKGLQIMFAIVGGGLSLSWLRVQDGHIMVNPERAKLVKTFSIILLWALAIGFMLELWYETHLLLSV